MTAHSGDGVVIDRRDSTVSLTTAWGRIEIAVCTSRIVRVRLASDGAPDGPSYLTPRVWPHVECAIQMGEPIVIDTGRLTVQIEAASTRLAFADAAGNLTLCDVVVGEPPRKIVESGSAPPVTGVGEQGVTGDKRVHARFEPVGAQHFYGLGEGGKQFDRLGSARQLWNSHFGHGPGSDIGVPLLLSNRGYGLFFDNTGDAALTVGRSDGRERIVYRAERGPLDWYYLAGADPRDVIGEMAELLGRAPLPPRWTLGYLQSTRHFADESEPRQLARTLREKRIPCDGLIFLSTYGDALGWNRGVGHLEFQPELFRAPAETLAEFREQGFHVITHEYPVLHEEAPLFAEAAALGYLLAEGYDRVTPPSRPTTNFHEGQRYIDFSNPAACAWWWERHRQLVKLGVEGWWLDGGEGPSATARLHGGDGVIWHNLYDRLRQQAFAEGEAADNPDRRVFLLCRSGGAGMQRDGAACWSGDINNTFPTLEAQVPLGLNTGLSGIPYWGTDIGGFFHPVTESGELYARWFQFGAFCPGFRSHGWVWREHTPWAHGTETEDICRRYVELRYRLLPYTYTLAWQAHTQGLPLMRPLVLNYPDDPHVWELGSEYLWGDDLLVAPVTREGVTSWPVYLPAGGWYDFWTQTRYTGPRGIGVDAPLDRLPLFVRAGAIVPMGPVTQCSDDYRPDEITLLVYPDGNSRFEIYEDDGYTNAYRQSHYALTSVVCDAHDDAITLTVAAPRGDAALIPPHRSYVWQVLADQPRRVTLETGVELPRQNDSVGTGAAWWHDGTNTLSIRVPSHPSKVLVEL